MFPAPVAMGRITALPAKRQKLPHWQTAAKMQVQDAAAATGPGGRIYAIGGATGGSSGGEGEVTLTSVEAYSPLHNQWEEMPAVNFERQDLGAARGGDGRTGRE